MSSLSSKNYSPQVSSLYIYPIKSAQPISISTSRVEPIGLSFDRRFMIIDGDGKFVTGRTDPKIAELSVTLQPDGITLTHPTLSPVILKYANFSRTNVSTFVWNDHFTAYSTLEVADTWLSYYLNKPVRLIYLGEESQRQAKKAEQLMSFADEYPMLIVSNASLEALNARSTVCHDMLQFRPNIVVDTETAFEEDTWDTIKIGEVLFKLVSPCARCVFTTLDLATHSFRSNQEPLLTLSQFRQNADGEIHFGMNMIALNEGVINQGDPIEVLTYKNPLEYINHSTIISDEDNTSIITTSQKISPIPATVNLTFADHPSIVCDTQRNLLIQLEENDITLDHRCRAGVCGRCKVKLVKGEVASSDMFALSDKERDQKMILACCSIPKTDLVIDQT